MVTYHYTQGTHQHTKPTSCSTFMVINISKTVILALKKKGNGCFRTTVVLQGNKTSL